MNSFLRGITAQKDMPRAPVTVPMITFVFILCFLFLTCSAFSQTHTSGNNHSGDWYTASTWSTAAPGNSPNASAININGYERVESGGLIINNNSPAFNIYDTLFIVGNFDLGQGKLTVQPNAIHTSKKLSLEAGVYIVKMSSIGINKVARIIIS